MGAFADEIDGLDSAPPPAVPSPAAVPPMLARTPEAPAYQPTDYTGKIPPEKIPAAKAAVQRLMSSPDYDRRTNEEKKASILDAVKAAVETAADAASFGLAPKIAAGVSAATGVGGLSYAEHLANIDADTAQNKANHPTATSVGTGVGMVAGAALPVGAAARGASLAAKVGRGAAAGTALGGAQGFGDSRGNELEDTTKGAFLGGLVGGAAPAAAAGLGKVASKSVFKTKVADVVGANSDFAGANATEKKRLAQSLIEKGTGAPPVKEALATAEGATFAKLARDNPTEARAFAQREIQKATVDRAQDYATIEAAKPFDPAALRADLLARVAKAQKPAHATEREAFGKLADEIKDHWIPQTKAKPSGLLDAQGNPIMSSATSDVSKPTVQDLRDLTTDLLKKADSTMGSINESERIKLKEELKSVVNLHLNQHLDEAAKASPDAAKAVAAIKTMNRQVSAWHTLDDVLKNREAKVATQQLGMGGGAQKAANALAGGVGVAGAATALATGHPLAAGLALAVPVVTATAPAVGRGLKRHVPAALETHALQSAIGQGAPKAVIQNHALDFVFGGGPTPPPDEDAPHPGKPEAD